MTNWDFYGDSYQLAAFAYDVWCDVRMKSDCPLCDVSGACETCHARWYTLPFRLDEHADVRARAESEFGVPFDEIKWETSAESELRTRMLRRGKKADRRAVAAERGWSSWREYKASGYQPGPGV